MRNGRGLQQKLVDKSSVSPEQRRQTTVTYMLKVWTHLMSLLFSTRAENIFYVLCTVRYMPINPILHEFCFVLLLFYKC